MKLSPICRTKKLGMIYTILEIFCSFLNLGGPQTRPRKIPDFGHEETERIIFHLYMGLGVKKMTVQCKQKGADQAAHVCSRISTFLLAFLKG